MLIGLGTAAAQQSGTVRHTPATRLVNELVEAADVRQLVETIAIASNQAFSGRRGTFNESLSSGIANARRRPFVSPSGWGAAGSASALLERPAAPAAPAAPQDQLLTFSMVCPEQQVGFCCPGQPSAALRVTVTSHPHCGSGQR